MSRYRWNGHELVFENKEDTHQKITKLFVIHSEKAKQKFKDGYKSKVKGYDQNTATAMAELACSVLETEMDSIKDDIRNEKLYIRINDICNMYEDGIYEDIVDIHKELVSGIIEIKNIQDDMKALREERKLYRSRWVGGGFGIRGAMKGAVEASILNTATGMGVSAINAIGNFRTSVKVCCKVSQILDSGSEAMLQAIINGIAVIYHACLDARGVEQLYTETMIRENELTLEQHKNDNSELAAKCLFNNIRNNPYNREQYTILIEKYGDSEDTLNRIGNACGIDVEKIKRDILTRECEGFKTSLYDENLRKNFLYIQKRKKTLGFTGEIAKETSIRKYLKNDLENELKGLVEKVKSGDEKSTDEAFIRINEIRTEFDMANGILEDILKQIAR